MESASLVCVGIQKRGGHMFDASCTILSSHWNLDLPPEAGSKGRELTDIVAQPRGAKINGKLLMCRIEDIVDNLNDGILDIGIVSSDVLSEWEAANQETFSNNQNFEMKNIGFAGSRLMIGVAQAFLEDNQDISPERAMVRAIKFSFDNNLPIFTSFREDVREFLKLWGLPAPDIARRRGTTEAQAKLAGAVVIADLVESGTTMRDNGFEPIKEIGESRILLISRIPEDRAKRPAISALVNAVPGSIYYG